MQAHARVLSSAKNLQVRTWDATKKFFTTAKLSVCTLWQHWSVFLLVFYPLGISASFLFSFWGSNSSSLKIGYFFRQILSSGFALQFLLQRTQNVVMELISTHNMNPLSINLVKNWSPRFWQRLTDCHLYLHIRPVFLFKRPPSSLFRDGENGSWPDQKYENPQVRSGCRPHYDPCVSSDDGGIDIKTTELFLEIHHSRFELASSLWTSK